MKIGEAADFLGLLLGRRQRRQQHRRQYGNDGDDDEQLNQGKSGASGLPFMAVGMNECLRQLRAAVRWHFHLVISGVAFNGKSNASALRYNLCVAQTWDFLRKFHLPRNPDVGKFNGCAGGPYCHRSKPFHEYSNEQCNPAVHHLPDCIELRCHHLVACYLK